MDYPLDLDGVSMRPGEPIGSQLPQAYLHLTTGDRVPLHFTRPSDVLALAWWLIGVAGGRDRTALISPECDAYYRGRYRREHPDA